MTVFRVDRFSGERPLMNPRKLPDGHAAAAWDSNLVANDLRAFRSLAHIANVSSVTTPKSAFIFSETQGFVFGDDVDATYGPIQADEDVDNKVYIGNGFQSYPVYSTKRIGLPDPDGAYFGPPIAWRKLGVPAAPTKAILELSAVESKTFTKLEAVGDLMVVFCTAEHGLSEQDRVRIEGLATDWSDIDGKTFTISKVEDEPTQFSLNNYDPAPHSGDAATPSGSGSWFREYNPEDYEDRIYVWTLVTDQGEEGPPSDPTELITLAPGQSVTVTTGTSPTVDDAIVEYKRIYRTVPNSSGGAEFYFVAEIPVSQADFEDTLDVLELGEPLPSLDWSAPPEQLKGLTVLANGIVAGFVGRTLYLSEPYQPHAWPERYTKQMDHEIVGLAAFAQSIIVATEENPYVGTATDPLSMTLSKLDSVEPCISKRACKTLGYGAAYPSPNGLIVVTPRGTRNVLDGVWDEKEWRELMANGAFADVHNGRYYLLLNNGTGIVFDPTSETLEISRINTPNTYGMAVDRDKDRLYLLRFISGPKVYEWNPDDGTTYITANWTSQTFVMPYTVNMGAFQVFFEGSGSLEIDFYADGVLKHTATVTDQEPQRLPSGFLAREWSLEMRSTVSVQGVYVAETISELRGALAR
jgi:hypothetical protein